MNVVFTRRALRDLDLIYEFIASDSPYYAQRQVEKIIGRATQISRFPRSGRQVPEFARRDVREVLEGRYRIIYRIATDARRCDVLTIVHDARLLASDAALGDRDA